MTMRFENVVFDARDPRELGQWWAEALGWVVHAESDDEVDVCEALRDDGSYPFPELIFSRKTEPERGRERVHLDLNSFSFDDQQATVERLLTIGARLADVGQRVDAPFVVLADPEGNHFCVLDARPEYAHLGSLAGYTLAAHDAFELRDLWAEATGWDLTQDDPDYMVLTPPGGGPSLDIITRPTMSPLNARNRLHLDVRPVGGQTQAEAVERLLALGAHHLDIGQSADPTTTWVVLADPEGNELCVLAASD